LGTRRQQLVEMSAPASRVLAVAIAAHLGEVQNAFQAPTDAARRFGLCRPDTLEHLEHKAGVDRLHGQCADNGVGIGGERRAPLSRVLAVAPSGAVRADVGLRALLEAARLRRVEPLPRPLSPPRLDRVYPLVP